MHAPSIMLAGDTAYYHVTHWKAGSQWFLALFRDAFGAAVVQPQELVKHAYQAPGETGKVYPCCYLQQPEVLSLPAPAQARRFVVIRDLRDTLVSGYFSIRFSHTLMGQIEKYRWFLNRWNTEDGLIYLMQTWLCQSAPIQRTWLRSDERIYKLEDFMSRPAEMLGTVLREGWGLDASPAAIEGLAARHAFTNYSGGRARGEEDLRSHYRKGVHGDWRAHFTPRVTERFKELYNDILLGGGYETTADWQ